MTEAANYQNGRLRVISGRGYVTYSKDSGADAKHDRALHLGGTLIEWTFKLDEDAT